MKDDSDEKYNFSAYETGVLMNYEVRREVRREVRCQAARLEL